MSTQRYTITMDTETGTITRRNEGFNVFELVGILKMTEDDLLRQLNHESDSPIEVVKEYVKPEEK
jgi:hypothetical protein